MILIVASIWPGRHLGERLQASQRVMASSTRIARIDRGRIDQRQSGRLRIEIGPAGEGGADP